MCPCVCSFFTASISLLKHCISEAAHVPSTTPVAMASSNVLLKSKWSPPTSGLNINSLPHLFFS